MLERGRDYRTQIFVGQSVREFFSVEELLGIARQMIQFAVAGDSGARPLEHAATGIRFEVACELIDDQIHVTIRRPGDRVFDPLSLE